MIVLVVLQEMLAMEIDAAAFSQTVESHDKGVVAALRSVVNDNKLMLLDLCVLSYLLRMLEGQMTPESYLPDDSIVETLSVYLTEFDCYESEAAAEAAARAVVAAMDKSGTTQRPKEIEALSRPLTIGKQYEDNMRRAGLFTGQKVTVNTNDEWSWTGNRDTAKTERLKRKEESKKTALQDEYEEYLKKRGIAVNAKVVKLHHKDDSYGGVGDIRCNNIQIRMGKQLLFDEASLTLLMGHSYGFVGKNGAGKTTLLRALSEGELEGINPFVQILHVEQEISACNESPIQVVLEADAERAGLMREEQELLKAEDDASSARLSEIYERMDAIDAHSAEARAATILHGLSFTTEMMNEPTRMLSGGWRMRVALARALFVEPDVLLLDEPTNHLDLHAVLWLEQFLTTWPKTLVTVSHSRSFLNAVCTEIVHLEHQKLTYYKGDYDSFESTRAEQLKLQAKTHETQEKQKAHMQAFVDKFRYSAARAKMAQSRLKAIERMEMVGAVTIDHGFSFSFPDPEEAGSPYLQVVDCEFGYKAGSTLFTDVNFSVDVDSRIALVGPNGAGKSTFVKMCLAQLEPRKGQVIRNPHVRIGHFAQHHLDLLTPQQSSLEFMRIKFPSAEEPQLRAHLGSFGLSADKALQPIYTLSGGQKSRLALAWITHTKPHMLLLDEPTNHLDIDTVDALLRALLEFKGGLLVVSHDEHFINTLCEETYVCGAGQLKKYPGDFDDYKNSISAKLKTR
jgi:ATP-binding cassette subfamily F protein 3